MYVYSNLVRFSVIVLFPIVTISVITQTRINLCDNFVRPLKLFCLLTMTFRCTHVMNNANLAYWYN